MDRGFILISRSLLDSEVFASQKLIKIWLWCLLKANFKDRNIPLKVGRGERVIKVKRGSFLFGRFKAEEELCIDGSTIYKSIKKLESMDMISIKSNNQYSVITITNYDSYQDIKNYTVATKEQPSNNQVTAKEQPSNTTKELKKDKEYNKKLLSELKSSDVENEKHLEITLAFWKLFKSNLEEKNISTANIEKAKGTWINPIKLLIEKDKYSADDLRDVFQFLKVDDFWSKNILSTEKLRKQFDKLLLNSRSNGKANKRNNEAGATWDEIGEILNQKFGHLPD